MLSGVQGSRNNPSQNTNQPQNAPTVQRVGSLSLSRYQMLVDAIMEKDPNFSNLIESGPALTDEDKKNLRRWAKTSENSTAYHLLKSNILPER